MSKMREKTTATLLTAIFLISIFAVAVPIYAKESATIPIHQVQLQCRRWDPTGWRNWYWNYDSTLEIVRTGNVIHTEISYLPAVSEEEGTSMVWIYNKFEDKYILHEGTVKYLSPISGLWIVEYWRGYLEFDENGVFEHGVTYQFGYTYDDDAQDYYGWAFFDDTMGAWRLGFSVYIWDPSDFDQCTYFEENPPDDLQYHKYYSTNPQHEPYQDYSLIEPVPANIYNPWGL